MKSSLTSASFWIDVAERAVRGFAQGTLAALGVGAAGYVAPGVSVPWLAAVVVGGTSGAAISVLTSLASLRIPGADPETGSFLAAPPNQGHRLRVWLSARRSQ